MGDGCGSGSPCPSTIASSRLRAERDADLRVDTQRLTRELPDNLFGRAVWESFQTAPRTFLASAEAVFRARRDDPAFDFSGPAAEYAKAVETELNALVFPRLRKRLEGGMLKDREVVAPNGRRLDLGGRVAHQSLGTILHLLENDDSRIRRAGLPASRRGCSSPSVGSARWSIRTGSRS